MRLVFAGTPAPAVEVLRALHNSEHEVCAVVTQPDARQGRGRSLRPSPVAQWAEEHGIEVLKPATLRGGSNDGEKIRARLLELAPDCIPVVAYGQLIPDDLLTLPHHGWVNLHFSLLPRWRGAAPVQYALLHGDTETGLTIFRIDKGLDTGPILSMLKHSFPAGGTSAEVLAELATVGAQCMVDTIDGLERGSITPREQQGEATYAPKISVADAHLDLVRPAQEVLNAIRAYTPVPGAWVWADNDESVRMKIGAAELAADNGDRRLAPGRLRVEKNAVFVGTGSGDIVLRMVQAPGKKMMDAAAWARGAQGTEDMQWH